MSAVKRNNVRVVGSGLKSIVFAHGYGCDQNMWRFIAPAFESEYRIVLFDHVGAGGSDLSQYDAAKYGTLHRYAEDLLELCDELDLENSYFVGHSVGAIIGLLAAIRSPRVFEKLVLVSPSPCHFDDDGYTGGIARSDLEELLSILDRNYLGWVSTMAPLIMGAPDRPELATELSNSFCRTDPEIAKQFARVTLLSDHRSDLPLLSQPALILQCTSDAIAPETVGKFMHQQLRNSRLVLMEATGHCPHLSAPDETISAIKAFL